MLDTLEVEQFCIHVIVPAQATEQSPMDVFLLSESDCEDTSKYLDGSFSYARCSRPITVGSPYLSESRKCASRATDWFCFTYI